MVSNDAVNAPLTQPRRPGATVVSSHTLSRRRALALPPAIAALVALGGCGVFGGSARAQAYDTDVTHREIPLEDAPTAEDAVAACAALSESLLRSRLAEDPNNNALTCPAGAALAVALLYAGSDTPADGVNELLGTSGTSSTVRDTTWSALQNSLLTYDPSEEDLDSFDPDKIPETPLLHIANRALLVGDHPAVEQTYLDAARQWYNATTEHATHNQAKAALDAWAKRHTGGLIESSGIEITDRTRLVLQNALLFAAGWSSTFDANHTHDGDFTLADGSTTTARLMQDEFLLSYTQDTGWQAVRLLYQDPGHRLAMDVILPDEGTTPADLPEGTWQQASTALNKHGEREVLLTLPTFDLQHGPVDLVAFLRAQGIELDSLDHIGKELFVDQAVQQVRLMVKEEGTVAGALTEISELAGAAPGEEEDKPISFTVDRPFALRIHDRLTGLVLIEGVIMDPTASSE